MIEGDDLLGSELRVPAQRLEDAEDVVVGDRGALATWRPAPCAERQRAIDYLQQFAPRLNDSKSHRAVVSGLDDSDPVLLFARPTNSWPDSADPG